VYYTLFKCNLKMIRSDYPRLHAWLRRLYWSEGPETAGGVFKKTTLFDAVSTCKRSLCPPIPDLRRSSVGMRLLSRVTASSRQGLAPLSYPCSCFPNVSRCIQYS
jgi:hypothetical protein